MKRIAVSCLICLIVFFFGCASAAQPVSAPTPAPISAVDLLADALMHYEAGDYEEAIIAYMGVIEIEPRNIEAQIGLGRAYRNAGKNEEAIAALTAAREMDAANMEAAHELGYAYLGAGQYEAAETLASTLWNDTGDIDAGVTLLMSLAA